MIPEPVLKLKGQKKSLPGGRISVGMRPDADSGSYEIVKMPGHEVTAEEKTSMFAAAANSITSFRISEIKNVKNRNFHRWDKLDFSITTSCLTIKQLCQLESSVSSFRKDFSCERSALSLRSIFQL